MILVVGATGSLGGRVTRGLLARGEAVRILGRENSPSEDLAKMGRANTAQSLIDAGAALVYGDLKDRASLDSAVAGMDTIITTATATQRGDADTLESVDRQGTLNLVDAARQAGVRHFIYTSAAGASADHPGRLFQIKDECERAIAGSGMLYTILQPTIFMEIWIGMVAGMPLSMGQSITLIGQGDHAHNFISEADVAAFLVSIVNNPAAYDRTILAGGPASYTWTEVVDAIASSTGSDLPLTYLPLGSAVPLLPPMATEMLNAHETYEDFVDMSETAPAFGVTSTPLVNYIERAFVP